jgi:hypothetical protein
MDKGNVLDTLQVFVDRAEKMGKYPANSANALKSTIKLASGLLTDEEPRTLEYFRDHADEIFTRSTGHSAPSIQAYIGRVKRLVEDYQVYGAPASAMLNWKTTPRPAAKRPRRDGAGPAGEEAVDELRLPAAPNANVLSLALRENVKARLELPSDMTGEEADRICALVKSLVAFAKK